MRDHNYYTGIALLLLALPAILVGASTATPAETEATEAAESWLALLDAREFHESWAEAGETFQDAFTAEAWAEQAAGTRQQLGEVVSREVTATTPLTDPPGAPPGSYVQVQYRSEFSEIGPANEMVVVVDESARGWRVVGYFVQPAADG